MPLLVLLFALLVAGCVSQPRMAKRTLSDFHQDQVTYAAYLKSYRSGYEKALEGWTSDIDYFGRSEFSPVERATAIGFNDGQSDGATARMRRDMEGMK